MDQSSVPQFHEIFARQAQCLANRDIDGLMALYHPEAEWIRFQGVLVGREKIRETIEQYMKLDLEFVEMNEYIHGDDVVMVRSTMKVQGHTEVAFGIYVIRDGLIWRQTGAVEGGMRTYVH